MRRKKNICYRDDNGNKTTITYTEASVRFSVELFDSIRNRDTQKHGEVINRWIARGMERSDILETVTSMLSAYGAQCLQHSTVHVAMMPSGDATNEDPLAGLDGLRAPQPVQVSFVRKVIQDVRLVMRQRDQQTKATRIDGILKARKVAR
jgi:hypothetical protein